MRGERLAGRLVTPARLVNLERVAVCEVPVAAEYGFKRGHGSHSSLQIVRMVKNSSGSLAKLSLKDLLVSIEIAVAHLDLMTGNVAGHIERFVVIEDIALDLRFYGFDVPPKESDSPLRLVALRDGGIQ